jgi:trehalose 6-phosphate phosphatase
VRVSPAATLVQALEPLRSDPPHGVVLLDVDGTLAPIVAHAEDAHVPEATRVLLIEVTKRYGLVACVSGRRAQEARQIVAIGSIAYVGNHGGELLRPGSTKTQLLDSTIATWGERVAEFAQRAYSPQLRTLRVRFEDKGIIVAFHWRGARDEEEAEGALREVATDAEREGLGVHWGRKVLEIRPPVTLEKGRGIAALLADSAYSAAMYVGDDLTDVDAFRQLRKMLEEGSLKSSLCVAVASDEAPPELVETADLVVDGPGDVRALLAALL